MTATFRSDALTSIPYQGEVRGRVRQRPCVGQGNGPYMLDGQTSPTWIPDTACMRCSTEEAAHHAGAADAGLRGGRGVTAAFRTASSCWLWACARICAASCQATVPLELKVMGTVTRLRPSTRDLSAARVPFNPARLVRQSQRHAARVPSQQ